MKRVNTSHTHHACDNPARSWTGKIICVRHGVASVQNMARAYPACVIALVSAVASQVACTAAHARVRVADDVRVADGVSVAHLGNFTAENAAFLSVATIQGAPALIISQFTGDPLQSDGVAAVLNISSYLGNLTGAAVTTLTSTLVWPNEVNQVTEGFGAFSGLLEAGGFLVPPKCVGGVNFIGLTPNGSVSRVSKVSRDDGNALFGGYFYHRAIPHDVDGDGYVDIIAARAIKPLIGTPGGELVWMRQPPGVPDPLDPSLLPWENHTLMTCVLMLACTPPCARRACTRLSAPARVQGRLLARHLHAAEQSARGCGRAAVLCVLLHGRRPGRDCVPWVRQRGEHVEQREQPTAGHD